MEELLKRINPMLDKTTDCWLWLGDTRKGYGRISWKGTGTILHRLTWVLSGGEIPEGHVIRHKCRNKNCCNPEHLETGTNKENTMDRYRDDTILFGERHPRSKFTEQQIREIRLSPLSGKELATQYNTTKTTITEIKLKKTWGWFEPDGHVVVLEEAKGERSPHAKLTAEQVREIKISTKTQTELGQEYGVGKQTIADILHNKTWKHI